VNYRAHLYSLALTHWKAPGGIPPIGQAPAMPLLTAVLIFKDAEKHCVLQPNETMLVYHLFATILLKLLK
jgi:hypothetical protein